MGRACARGRTERRPGAGVRGRIGKPRLKRIIVPGDSTGGVDGLLPLDSRPWTPQLGVKRASHLAYGTTAIRPDNGRPQDFAPSGAPHPAPRSNRALLRAAISFSSHFSLFNFDPPKIRFRPTPVSGSSLSWTAMARLLLPADQIARSAFAV